GYWVSAVSTGNWSYNSAAFDSSLTSGHRYLILSRAYDNAGNLQSAFTAGTSSVTFGIDRSSPTSAIASPAGGAAYQATALAGVNAFTGTAADGEAFLYAGSDPLQSVEYALRYLESGTSFYWNGSAFTSAITEAA